MRRLSWLISPATAPENGLVRRIDLLLTETRAARRVLREVIVETLAQRDLAWRTAADLPLRPRLTDSQRARFEAVLARAALTRRRR